MALVTSSLALDLSSSMIDDEDSFLIANSLKSCNFPIEIDLHGTQILNIHTKRRFHFTSYFKLLLDNVFPSLFPSLFLHLDNSISDTGATAILQTLVNKFYPTHFTSPLKIDIRDNLVSDYGIEVER